MYFYPLHLPQFPVLSPLSTDPHPVQNFFITLKFNSPLNLKVSLERLCKLQLSGENLQNFSYLPKGLEWKI
jgi:hypothetical protein